MSFDHGEHGFYHGEHARHGIKRVFKILAFAIAGVIMAAFFGLLFGWLVELLWNWLMPAIFGLKVITYWQAFGLVILGKLLFSGFGHHARPFQHGALHHLHDNRDRLDREWKPGGSYKNWHFYHHYWEEEGKAAFENYLERKGLNKKDKE